MNGAAGAAALFLEDRKRAASADDMVVGPGR
jgi:hypothetical protein